MPGDGPRLARIKANLQRRAAIIDSIRTFFRNEGFLEVDTPVRVPVVAPEQYIAPFTSEGWFLSTSPELQMKRLLAAGYEKLFQICHCFRKEERGRLHTPEFTMLEWYRAGADYTRIIQDTEQLLSFLAITLGVGPRIAYRGSQIDLTPPWVRTTVREAFLKAAGWNPVTDYDPERFDVDLVDRVIPQFSADRPTVLMDYPAACASLSRLKPGNPLVAERAEVFIGGLEIANAYSELNDAAEQEQRFRAEIERMRLEGKPALMPHRFLEAIAHLPICGGIALGVDRLVMLLCNAATIDEVIAFPPETM